jgi:hypothetical protein
MKLAPIVMSDAQAIRAVIDSNQAMHQVAKDLLAQLQTSGCSEHSERSFRLNLGKIAMVCAEISLQILTDNQTSAHCIDSHTEALRDEIQDWRSRLGDEIADCQMMELQPPFEWIQDKSLARVIVAGMDLIDEKMLEAIDSIRESQCSDSEKTSYLVACGVLRTLTAGVKLEVFLGQEDLIPTEFWRETVDAYKAKLDRIVSMDSGRNS